MHRLVYRFRLAARVLVSLVTAAFLLASLATAANAYPALSSCSRHADHFTPNTAGSIGHPASHQASNQEPGQAHHHDAAANAPDVSTPDANIPDAGDACCGNCDHCNGYFEAHLQGLNLATAPATTLSPNVYASTPPGRATDFVNRPHLPPPKSAFVLR